MGVSTNVGGSLEVGASSLTPHFTVMSNELSTPNTLACGRDESRKAATNFTAFADYNISYFLDVDIVTRSTPDIPLAGDWNLTNQTLAGGRIVRLERGATLGWNEKVHQRQGNILWADGSVGQFSSGKLPPLKTNAQLVLPPAAPRRGFLFF